MAEQGSGINLTLPLQIKADVSFGELTIISA
jgi:hypothetical protein